MIEIFIVLIEDSIIKIRSRMHSSMHGNYHFVQLHEFKTLAFKNVYFIYNLNRSIVKKYIIVIIKDI